MAAVVGQPYKYVNASFETAKIGGNFLCEDSGNLTEWNTSTMTASGTGVYRVAVFAADGTNGDPGTLLGESDEISIDTSDIWRNIPFSTPVALTKDVRYWVIGWSDVAYAIYYADCEDGFGRYYADTTGTYPTWEDPAEADNGSTVVRVEAVLTGYGLVTQTSVKPSYISTVSIPMDGAAASNTATQNTWTPLQGLISGDLVIVAMQQRGTATMSVGVTGGQSWSSFSGFNGTGNLTSTQIFYCTFNGTWGASPRFDFSAGTNTSVVVSAFRPGVSSSTWGVDVTQSAGTFTAPTTPFAVTITGISPAQANNVSMAVWVTADDNTWGDMTGTDWYANNFGQFRNVAGSDASMTQAHKIQASSGATGNVMREQNTLGGDAGATSIFAFYEIPAAGGNTTNFFF